MFDERHARRLYAYVEDTNQPSQRLCRKLGMRLEGTFMEFVSFMNDQEGQPVYENTMQYAILRREWGTLKA
ncbi:GNAT family N-acetyltransferase [Acetobacter cerevisiae]|uniref:GNAT family N-acetyltransferase n=1 Tax=Acetobacter cerevisiae TaxID=178900 RepID=A0ABT1EVH9_9PROT|nr:GNAT family N-acetyltransferase [Acetobacter cerevisiae]MCP1256960.1 GNAT family N-acetyltransferase [Acetobacter cerevisiae]